MFFSQENRIFVKSYQRIVSHIVKINIHKLIEETLVKKKNVVLGH